MRPPHSDQGKGDAEHSRGVQDPVDQLTVLPVVGSIHGSRVFESRREAVKRTDWRRLEGRLVRGTACCCCGRWLEDEEGGGAACRVM
jgi:hypothetical protein